MPALHSLNLLNTAYVVITVHLLRIQWYSKSRAGYSTQVGHVTVVEMIRGESLSAEECRNTQNWEYTVAAKRGHSSICFSNLNIS